MLPFLSFASQRYCCGALRILGTNHALDGARIAKGICEGMGNAVMLGGSWLLFDGMEWRNRARGDGGKVIALSI